jgi:hypothetical protein
MEENKKQELIKSSGSEKEAIKKIERITALQLLQEEELEGMSEENLKEFDRLALQLYLIDENDLVLQSVWGENLLAYIQPKAVEEFYHNTDN